MKFNVEIEDYSDCEKNAAYENASVKYNGEEMVIYVNNTIVRRVDYVRLYSVSNEYMQLTCMIPHDELDHPSLYGAGEITMTQVE